MQYLRSGDLEEIKRTLIVLDNTNDKLVEIIPGVLAFLNSIGHVRLINLKTLEEINTEPLKIESIVNNKILLKNKKKFWDGKYRSMLVDLDTYEVILDENIDLCATGDLIYTSELGILSVDKKEFKIYNSSGNVIFEDYINTNLGLVKIGKTNIYMFVYGTEYLVDTSSKNDKAFNTSFLKYDVLNQSCKQISVLRGKYKIDTISDYTAILTKSIDDEPISDIVDFSLIEREDTNELSKIVNYKINL